MRKQQVLLALFGTSAQIMRACAIARARKCAKEPCGCALCARAPMGARAPRRAHAAVRPCPAHAQEDARVALARARARALDALRAN